MPSVVGGLKRFARSFTGHNRANSDSTATAITATTRNSRSSGSKSSGSKSSGSKSSDSKSNRIGSGSVGDLLAIGARRAGGAGRGSSSSSSSSSVGSRRRRRVGAGAGRVGGTAGGARGAGGDDIDDTVMIVVGRQRISLRDSTGRLSSHPSYDPSTLLLSPSAMHAVEASPTMIQYYKAKCAHFDKVSLRSNSLFQ